MHIIFKLGKIRALTDCDMVLNAMSWSVTSVTHLSDNVRQQLDVKDNVVSSCLRFYLAVGLLHFKGRMHFKHCNIEYIGIIFSVVHDLSVFSYEHKMIRHFLKCNVL